MDFDSFTPTAASTNPQANQGGRVAPLPSVARPPKTTAPVAPAMEEAAPTVDFDSFDPSATPSAAPTLPRISTPSIVERNSAALARVGASRSVDGTMVTTSPTPEADAVNLDLLAASRFTPQQIAEFKKNPINWSQAQNYLDFADILPAGGLYKGGKAIWLTNVAGKLERGEDLTEGEKTALYAAVDKNIEMSLRGFTVGGGVKYYGLQMPAFMMEFAATAGVGKAAQVGAVKGAEKLAMTTVENAAARTMGRVALKATGGAANITARTAAMPSLYTAQYGERRLNDEIAITDKGDLLLKESQESPAKSALMAFSYSSANVASEMAGGPLGKYVTGPALSAVKTPLIAAVNKVPVPVREALYEAYKTIKPTAKVSDVFTAAGWNGMLNELGENRIQDVLNATLGLADPQQGPKTFDEYLDALTPSKDQVLIEAGIIGIAGGAKTSADISFNLLRSKGIPDVEAKDMVDNMSATEQEGFVNKHLQTPTSDLPELVPEESRDLLHGTSREFENFSVDGEGVRDRRNQPRSGTPFYYFTDKPEIAERFSKQTGGRSYVSFQKFVGDDFDFDGVNTLQDALTSPDFKQEAEDFVSALKKHAEKGGKFSAEDYDGNEYIFDDPMKAAELSFDEDNNVQTIKKGREGRVLSKKVYGRQIDLTDQKGYDALTEEEKAALATVGIKGPLPHNDFSHERFGGKLIDAMRPFGIGSIKVPDVYESGFYSFIVDPIKIEGNYEGSAAQKAAVAAGNPELVGAITKAQTIAEVESDGTLVIGTLEGDAADAQTAAAVKLDPPKIDHSESFFNEQYRQWVNELDPIQSLPERARKQGKYIVPNADTKLLTTAYAGTLGAIRQNIQVATFVKDDLGNNVITGKALKPILDDFSNMMLPYEPNVKQREQDFADYLVARRYLKDLHGRDDVEVTEAQKLESIKKLTDLHTKYGNELTFFDTFAKEVYGFQQRILHNLVDSGVMSKESYDKILKENPNYIPFDRVLDTEEFAGGVSTNGLFTKANANRIVKRIKGSDKEVKNVFQTMIKNTANIIDMSRRNEVARSIANLADTMPQYIRKVPTPMMKVAEEKDGTAIFRPSPHQPRDTIVVREGGKKQYYEVSKPILEAVENIGASQLNFIERALQTSASVLRAGATLVPEFWVRNVLRDQQGALLQSGVKYRPTDFARGLWAVMGKTELYNEWERSGGSFNSYMELDDKGLEKAFKELIRDDGKLMRYLNPINIAADISGGLEQATRIGVFSRAQKEGQTALQATLTSRDATLNFSRRGSQGKRVNTMVPFFNAGIQGSDKLIRTFKEHPVASTLWGLSTITLPSVALAGYYLYSAPDDERQEYLEIPQWQRDLFWVVKVDGEWRRYPKPFSYGYIFGSMPERMMLWMYKGDKPEGEAVWKDVAMGLGAAFVPMYDGASLLPPIVKTSVESISGYNFFTGRDIYPDWMKRLDPEERSNKYTSDTAKFVGEGLGVSPAKVDNALRGTLAGSADYATRAGDFVLGEVKKWNGEVDNTGEKPVTDADRPLVRAFAVRRPAGYRSNSAAKFFENYEQVQQRRATSKEKEGKEQAAYIKEHGRVIGTYGLMNGAYKQMKSLQDEIDAVYDDPKMASERKVARINKLEDQITTVARDANRSYSTALKGADKK